MFIEGYFRDSDEEFSVMWESVMYSEQTFDETQFAKLLDFVRKKSFVIIKWHYIFCNLNIVLFSDCVLFPKLKIS